MSALPARLSAYCLDLAAQLPHPRLGLRHRNSLVDVVFAEDLFKPGGVFGQLTQKDVYMLSLNCHGRDFVVRALRLAKERVLAACAACARCRK